MVMEQKSLTPRQVEFLAKSAKGMTYSDISKECFISEKTVSKALYEARQRLGAKNNLHCLSLAICRGEMFVGKDGMCCVSN